MDESLSGIILMVLHFDLSCFKLKLKKMTHHFHGRLEKPWFVNHTPNWGLLVVVVVVFVCVCVCVEWWEVEGWSVIRREHIHFNSTHGTLKRTYSFYYNPIFIVISNLHLCACPKPGHGVVVVVFVCVCVCVEWWEVEGGAVIRRNIYTELFIFNLWWIRGRNSLLYTLWIKLKTSYRP
jgi:hypothetical protein